MAIKSSFFNSVGDDRIYLAEDFASYFASFIGNGVFPNPSNGLQVVASATSGMSLTIKQGKAWINGYYFVNDSDYNLTAVNADGVLNRIDRVVLRLDYLARTMRFVYKKGLASSNPVAPSINRNVDIYELALADIFVGKGVLSITQANITDQRLNKDLCGIVTGVIDQVDTTHIFNQYQDWYNHFTNDSKREFDDWFQTVTDILDSNVAGNLLSNIEDHKKDYKSHPAIAYTSNVGNAYSTSIYPAPDAYADGMGIVIKMNASSTGDTTLNVNGLGPKQILKGSGTRVKALYKDGMYTLRYNATALNGVGAFILQGEGGEYGTAGAGQVLKGYTIGTDNGILQGTIENRGSIGTVTPGTSNKAYGSGFYDSFSVLGDSDLVPTNIRAGINLFGVTGNFLAKDFAKGVATAQYMPNSKYAITVNTLSFMPNVVIITPTKANATNQSLFASMQIYINPSVYFGFPYSGYSQDMPIATAYSNQYGTYFTLHENKDNISTNNIMIRLTPNGFSFDVYHSGGQFNWVAFG